MAAQPVVSNESSSDDLKESCKTPNRLKRKDSILSKWKKSGLALRRYLYCLDKRSSDSSSAEEDNHLTTSLQKSSNVHSTSLQKSSNNLHSLSLEEDNHLTISLQKNSTVHSALLQKSSNISHHVATCTSLDKRKDLSGIMHPNPNILNCETTFSGNSSHLVCCTDNNCGTCPVLSFVQNNTDLVSTEGNSSTSLKDLPGFQFGASSITNKSNCQCQDQPIRNEKGVAMATTCTCTKAQMSNETPCFDSVSHSVRTNANTWSTKQPGNLQQHQTLCECYCIPSSNLESANLPFVKKKKLVSEVGNALESPSIKDRAFWHNQDTNSFSDKNIINSLWNNNETNHFTISSNLENQSSKKSEFNDTKKDLSISDSNFLEKRPNDINNQTKNPDLVSDTECTNHNSDLSNCVCLNRFTASNIKCDNCCICIFDDNHLQTHSNKALSPYNSGEISGNTGIKNNKPWNNKHLMSNKTSSDSDLTDSSSCDLADVSSYDVLRDASTNSRSPKRFRKRSKSKSPKIKDEDHVFSSLNLTDDIGNLETSLEYSPSGFLSSLSRIRLGSQISQASTESESLSTGNLAIEDTDNSGSIPGLNYAMPYLSDRLKSSLAQRIRGADSPCNKDRNRNSESDEIKQDHSQHDQDREEESRQGRELLNNQATNIEYMADERTLSDLLFNMEKIDMIDRLFLAEDHSQELGRIPNLDVPYNIVNNDDDHTEDVQEVDTTGALSDDGEADDEFECDCQYCVGFRVNPNGDQSYQEPDHRHNNRESLDVNNAMGSITENDGLDLWTMERDDEENMFTLNIEELSPLDFLMNNRRNELELMFENVIIQMLAVHPDLLGDQAPPPASTTVIQNLSSTQVTTVITSQSLSCPICLCVYEGTDSFTALPCQHNFHPLCIQAWLKQSGTCPVCRFVL